jgi:hypothetical protein
MPVKPQAKRSMKEGFKGRILLTVNCEPVLSCEHWRNLQIVRIVCGLLNDPSNSFW